MFPINLIKYFLFNIYFVNVFVDGREYCNADTFKANCERSEIILMKNALYGRIKNGKCLQEDEFKDAKYMGCFTNVMFLMDQKCSGLNTCEISFSNDIDFKKLNPCAKGLMLYLDSDYDCATIVLENNFKCQIQANSKTQHIIIRNKEIIHLKQQINCGSTSNPWIIESLLGQRIKFSLICFIPTLVNNKDNESIKKSITLGYIFEEKSNINYTIVNENNNKYSELFETKYNKVEASFRKHDESMNFGNNESILFILKFQAMGCSDLIPTEDAWLKRDYDITMIGCYSTRQTWTLNCIENQWRGVIGNCSADAINHVQKVIQLESNEKSELDGGNLQTLWILAISGCGLAICSIILGLGYLCLKKNTSKPPIYQSSCNIPFFQSVNPVIQGQGNVEPPKNVLQSFDTENNLELNLNNYNHDVQETNNYFILDNC